MNKQRDELSAGSRVDGPGTVLAPERDETMPRMLNRVSTVWFGEGIMSEWNYVADFTIPGDSSRARVERFF